MSFAVLRSGKEGAFFGLCAGFFSDLSCGAFFGRRMILGFLTGYLAGKPFKGCFLKDGFLPYALAGAFVFANQCADYFYRAFFQNVPFGFNFAYIFFAVMCAVYSAVFAMPVYKLARFINLRLEEYENR